MSNREKDGMHKQSIIEIDLVALRAEIIGMKTEAEEYLKTHSEDTGKVRAKKNILLNCAWLLEPYDLDGPRSCRGCTLADCSLCARRDL